MRSQTANRRSSGWSPAHPALSRRRNIAVSVAVWRNHVALGFEFGTWFGTSVVSWCHATMGKNLTLRLDDQLAADTEALARAEGKSLNETVEQALIEAVERRRKNAEFRKRLTLIIEQDRELLERLAK
jgi:hypothetical protein